MSIPVVISIANADPLEKWQTEQAVIDGLKPKITGEISEDFVPYVLQSATPAVEDQDKVWHRLDVTTGAPLGTYIFFDGTWRREPTGRPGDIKFYSGDPTVDFDPTGLGIVGGDQDGWALANGQNGTANLSNRFIIGGQMDNVDITGFDGTLWRTNITGAPLTVGGVADITLDDATTFRPATAAAVRVAHWQADGNTRDASGGLYGTTNNGGGDPTELLPADAGNEAPDSISVVNPFYALAILGWVGYA